LSRKKAAKPPEDGLIIDSSISIAWCFPDEQDEYAQSVLDALASEPAFVPYLWHLEVANTLLVGERRKRSTQANTMTWLGFLSALPIVVDDETRAHAFGTTLSLARDLNLSAYDAAYLELAIRRGLPLATLDDKLKAAALTVGVPLYGVHQAPRGQI
jgi:predicted nucleic acid-binding protein